jgi:hypothetical protein
MYIDHGGYQSICLVIPGAEIRHGCSDTINKTCAIIRILIFLMFISNLFHHFSSSD